MSHPVDPHDNSQQPTQQNTEGDKNQVIGEVIESTIYHISDTKQITINQAQTQPSLIESIKAQPLIQRSPYLGLRKFEVRDKDLFFGRDQLTSRLLDRLKEAPFLLVLGASGSGKSSLIRAGLIPKLSDMLGTGFRELIVTPDRDPFDSFRSSLRSAGFRQADLESLQTGKPETIVQVVRSLKSADEDWLIFIDQFEELFTLCQSLPKQQAFIDGLFQLMQDKLADVRMVAAMRADFLDRLGAYPRLSGILQWAELITDMGHNELRLAIEKPAAHHGVVLEPELTEEIIHDLKGQLDTVNEAERVSLPLLQYTLKLLWESSEDLSRDRTLRVSTYRALGGVRGALQRHVDEIYAPLPDEQKQAAKHIFLQLVDVTSADAGATAVGKAVSRRAALSEFSPAEQAVLRQLVDAGLLVSDDFETHSGLLSPKTPSSDRKATVELAHETLIDAWDTLKAWIEESRPLIRTKNQLREDAQRWYEIYQTSRAQAEAELWQGRKLQWLLSQKLEIEARFGRLKPEELQFIEACEELCDRTRRREVRRLRQTVAWIIGFLALSSGLTVFASYQWLLAKQEQIKAQSQAAQTQFAVNPNTLDSLIEALKAAEAYRRTPKLFGTAKLEPIVMEALTQSVTWVKEINRLEGHTDIVRRIAFSPDGQTLATAGQDHAIKLWSRNGQLLNAQMSHAAPVFSVAYSSNGKLIASGSEDGSIKIWTNQGQLVEAIPNAHNNYVQSVSFDPQKRFLASASQDGDLKLWEIQEGQPTKLVKSIQAHPQPVYVVTFSPNGETIATASGDNSVKFWTRNLEEKGVPLRGHTNLVYALSYSHDGNTIATGSWDGTVRLWQTNGQPVTTFPASNEGWTGVTFSSDDQWIIASSAAEEGFVKIWDRDGNILTSLKGHDGLVYAISLSPKESILATGGGDQSVRLWNLAPSSLVTVLDTPPLVDDVVLDVSFSRDGQLLASAVEDGSIEIWDWPSRKVIQRLTGHTEEVRGVNISPKGDVVASASRDGSIRLWPLRSDQQLLSIANAHMGGVNSVQFSPRGDRLVSGGEDSIAKLWDSEGRLLKTLVGHDGPIHRVGFSQNGQMIATASEDTTVRIWDNSGKLKYMLVDHNNAVWDVVFSPTGNLIATASNDTTIKLWNRNGKLLRTLTGHTGPVNAVIFDSTGEHLFSASSDKTVKVWDANGILLNTLVGHESPINGLGLSQDASFLASGGADGTVIVWHIKQPTLAQLYQMGCQRTGDFLTQKLNLKSDLCKSLVQK